MATELKCPHTGAIIMTPDAQAVKAKTESAKIKEVLIKMIKLLPEEYKVALADEMTQLEGLDNVAYAGN